MIESMGSIDEFLQRHVQYPVPLLPFELAAEILKLDKLI